MKPIKYTNKVTNKYIDLEFRKHNVLDEKSIKFLKNQLKERLCKEKLYLKNLTAVNLTIVKSTNNIMWEIAIYTKNRYFTIQS